MTSEQTVSEVPTHQGRLPLGDHQGHDEQTSRDAHDGQDGQNVPHGMGQSKSSRRRRRKRKGKGTEASGTEGSPAESSSGDTVSALQASIAPQPSAHQNGFQNNNQNGASAGTGKRWKKKFRDRDRQRTPENPGNIAVSASTQQNHGGSNGYRDANSHQPGNGGGFKRKGGSGGGSRQQQRGPRSFVGPMDHSYRVVNGNFAETPPSTIESHGNYGSRGHARPSFQSDSQPIDYSQGRVVPIAADAPTKIYFFIDDLFFIAKIQETARKLGVKVAFVKTIRSLSPPSPATRRRTARD